MSKNKRVRLDLEDAVRHHSPFSNGPCTCGMHESSDDPYISDRLTLTKLENWKTEMETMICIPDIPTSLERYTKLYQFYGLIDCEYVYYDVYDWAANLVVQRNLFYDGCIQMLGLCLRQTPLVSHPYLRRLMLQTYLKETGARRFAKWLQFLLGAMRPVYFDPKRIKL